MEDLQLRKENELRRIIRARKIITEALECGLITTKDICNLLKKNKEYAFSKATTYKELLLKQIIFRPFILCDQELLDTEIKEILPMMLQVRYQDEIEELEMMQELEYIDREELSIEKEMTEFAYYLSSDEGKQVLLNGYITSRENNFQKIKR